MAESAIQTGKDGVEEYISEINNAQVNVDHWTQLVGAHCTFNGSTPSQNRKHSYQYLTQAHTDSEQMMAGVQNIQDALIKSSSSKSCTPEYIGAFRTLDVHISGLDQEDLKLLLKNLDSPINQIAGQVSDLHISLEGEFLPVLSLWHTSNQIQKPSATKSSSGCPTDNIGTTIKAKSRPICVSRETGCSRKKSL